MNDLISRQDVIDVLATMQGRCTSKVALIQNSKIWQQIKDLPSAERKGKWLEKEHGYCDEESGIEEWQSCCCSVCGRYDTRPYMYYFDEPKYCSWFGAKMVEGEEDEVD